MSEIMRAVKGMNDLFADELSTWQKVEKTTADVFSVYGFTEIRTPILEELGVFVRGVGEGTDIVDKEMYTLQDRDGKTLCLRPENTASVVRALIENGKLNPDSEIKNYYMGPMFRRERPQRGRLRQFHQIGAEYLGVSAPAADVEVISMLHDLLTTLGITNLKLAINTLGQPQERAPYNAALRAYFQSHFAELCADCQRRLEKNTFRILDCKNPKCSLIADASPPISDFLQDESKQHFDAVIEGLTKQSITAVVMPRLVRGLDYYTRTVFEFVAETGLGAQNAVAGGGRYDGLVKNLGGCDLPGLGFSAGIERIVLVLQDLAKVQVLTGPQVTFVYADEPGKQKAFELVAQLRKARVRADIDHQSRSVKAQMRRADRLGARSVIVLGAREVNEEQAQLKMLADGTLNLIRLDVSSLLSQIK